MIELKNKQKEASTFSKELSKERNLREKNRLLFINKEVELNTKKYNEMTKLLDEE